MQTVGGERYAHGTCWCSTASTSVLGVWLISDYICTATFPMQARGKKGDNCVQNAGICNTTRRKGGKECGTSGS